MGYVRRNKGQRERMRGSVGSSEEEAGGISMGVRHGLYRGGTRARYRHVK